MSNYLYTNLCVYFEVLVGVASTTILHKHCECILALVNIFPPPFILSQQIAIK